MSDPNALRSLPPVNEVLDQAELADLNRRFGDIVARGTIRSTAAFPPERSSNDHPELPRLALRFDKWHFARLRLLIDAINECTGV